MSLLLSSLFKHHNLLLLHHSLSLLQKPTTPLTKIITSKSSHITKSFSTSTSEMVKAIRVHELGGPQVKKTMMMSCFVLCFLFSHVTLLT